MAPCCASSSSASTPRWLESARIQGTELVQPWDYKPSADDKEYTRIKLSSLDQTTSPFMVIHLPFFFHHSLDDSILRTALSVALSSFSVFAGRLRTASDNTGQMEVILNGKGASFSVANSSHRLEDVIPVAPNHNSAGKTTNKAAASGSKPACNGTSNSTTTTDSGFSFRPVDISGLHAHDAPRNLLGYLNKDSPLLHAQLTHLADGGCCLSAAFPHALGDLETCKMVMTLWGRCYTDIEQEAWKADGDKLDGTTGMKMGNGFDAVVAPPPRPGNNTNNKNSQAVVVVPKDKTTTTTTDTTLVSPRQRAVVDSAIETQHQQAEKQRQSQGHLATTSSLDADTILGVTTVYGREALAAYTAPALPEDWESKHFERRTFGTIPRLIGSAIWHVVIPGGTEVVAYHVPATRLAALKIEAASGLASAGVKQYISAGWISTMDALVARVWQALSTIKADRRGKKASKRILTTAPADNLKPAVFYLSMELRRRLVPKLPAATIGNCVWSVPLELPQFSPSFSSSAFSSSAPSSAIMNEVEPSSSSSEQQQQQEPTLGMLAGAVRAAIQSLSGDTISKELKWLEDQWPASSTDINQQKQGTTTTATATATATKKQSSSSTKAQILPVIIKGASNILPEDGAVVVSPWDWGADYSTVRFGTSSTADCTGVPVYHQPPPSKGPNVVFIVPAGRSMAGGGMMVHLTLHKGLAKEMRERFPVL